MVGDGICRYVPPMAWRSVVDGAVYGHGAFIPIATNSLLVPDLSENDIVVTYS